MKKSVNLKYTGASERVSLYDISVPDNFNNKIIIFLHGYMGYKDWGCWNLVMDFFNLKGYGFIKYNVSHNGGTINQPIDFTDLNAFAQNSYSKEVVDFEAIMEVTLSTFVDSPEIYIIGHSRGGGIALLQSDNGFVSKIASWAGISSIADRFPTGENLENWKNNGVYFRENGRTHQEMPHNYSQYLDFQNNSNRLNIESYCKNSLKPTLILHGDNDSSVSISEGQKIAEWLNVDLITINGANHTFGSSHPWNENELPEHLAVACRETLRFFEEESAETTEYKEKLSLMAQLVKLANSDQSIKEQEFNFLAIVGKQLGIDKIDFEKIFNEHIEFTPPKLELDRIVQFQRLVLLMNVDQHIESEELLCIRQMGLRMGLIPEATNTVLKEMRNYPNGVIPPNALISIFRTHYN